MSARSGKIWAHIRRKRNRFIPDNGVQRAGVCQSQRSECLEAHWLVVCLPPGCGCSLQPVLKLLFEQRRIRQAMARPSHFSRHYDVRATDLVFVPADCGGGEESRGMENLDHLGERESYRANIGRFVVSNPSDGRR